MVEGNYRVLVVEDEAGVASLYQSWVFEEWDVEVVTNVTEALSELDESIDLIVLDRRLPDGSGDDVLDALASLDYDPLVVAVTAVEPDFDIVDLQVDDYLVKPLSRETFRSTLERLAHRISYDTKLRGFYALASKMAVLEARKSQAELANSEAFTDLERRVERQRKETDAVLDRVASDGYRIVFQGLFRERRPAASE
jgi:two-component system response regulator AdeR